MTNIYAFFKFLIALIPGTIFYNGKNLLLISTGFDLKQKGIGFSLEFSVHENQYETILKPSKPFNFDTFTVLTYIGKL